MERGLYSKEKRKRQKGKKEKDYKIFTQFNFAPTIPYHSSAPMQSLGYHMVWGLACFSHFGRGGV